MSSTLQFIFWPLLAYLIGSIPSAVIAAKLFGLDDPRNTGSGNPGATNVLRSGNKLAAFFTLFGDVLKGGFPVVLAQSLGHSNALVALVAIGAFFGHLYPIFLGFKGGKGVATAIGVFAALSWKLVAVFVLVWLLSAAITRYSSLSALIAAAITGVSSFTIFNHAAETQLVGAVLLIVAFLFQRHRDNIDRLRNGTETKIGQNAK